MRTIIFIMILISVCMIYAQNNVWVLDRATDRMEGDWRREWWRFTYRDGHHDVRSPFFEHEDNNLNKLWEYRNQDFQPSNGWVLLHANLGRSDTVENEQNRFHVILYNTERGIIRFFFRRRVATTQNSEGFARIIACNSIDTNTTGILSTISLNKNYIYALDRRINSSATNSIGKITGRYTGHWMYMDAYVAYDPDVLQNINNRLLFYSDGVTVTNHHGNISGINRHHSFTTSESGNSVLHRADYVGRYIRRGLDLRSSIEGLIASVPSDHYQPGYVNNINQGISMLINTGITSIIPYVYTVAGLFTMFRGNSSGVSVTTHDFNANISGVSVSNFPITNLTLPQPNGIHVESRHFYNQILGVVQMGRSPLVEIRETGNNRSMRLTELPRDWLVNPRTGLFQTPSQAMVSINFKITTNSQFHGITPPVTNFLVPEIHEFVVNYRVQHIGPYPIYYVYTHFIDYDVARNIAISTRNNARIHDPTVTVKAIFNYAGNPSKEPYVFIARYLPTVTNINNNSNTFPVQPQQRIERITTNQTKNAMTLDRRFIIDSGATLTISGNVTANGNSTNNSHYGFEVRNGTLRFENVYRANIGNGILKVNGHNARIEAIGSRVILDNGRLLMKGEGEVNFLQRSSFVTMNYSQIIGHTNNTLLSINNSNINLSTNTTVRSGDPYNRRWGGIDINNSVPFPWGAGTVPRANRLNADISDIVFLTIRRSTVEIGESLSSTSYRNVQLFEIFESDVRIQNLSLSGLNNGILSHSSILSGNGLTIEGSGGNGLRIIGSSTTGNTFMNNVTVTDSNFEGVLI